MRAGALGVEANAVKAKVMAMMSEKNFALDFDADVKWLGALSLECDVEEHFMLSRPSQSYIVCTLVDYVDATAHLVKKVTAIDSGSSLTLTVECLLHNLRKKDLGTVRGFAGSLTLKRVGDLIIPHPIAGSNILDAARVGSD